MSWDRYFLIHLETQKLLNRPKKKFDEFGIPAELDAYGEVGPGWENRYTSVHMHEPQYMTLIAYPKPYSRGTNGKVVSEVVYVNTDEIYVESDLKKFRGKLQGKIIFTKPKRKLTLNFKPPAVRLSDEELNAIIKRFSPEYFVIGEEYRDKKININLDSVSKQLYIQTNELIRDVFENILYNAIKHNKNAIPEIEIKIFKEQKLGENYFKFEFQDNGVGISDPRKEKIFQRGYGDNKSVQGMGLGLSLVKTIIEKCHGEIWVEDRVKGDYSKGSNFIPLIPEVN